MAKDALVKTEPRGAGRLWRWYEERSPVTRITIPFGLAIACIGGAWTVLNEGEYGVALALAVLFLLFGIQAARETAWSTTAKCAVSIVVAVIAIYSGLVILSRARGKPWTNLFVQEEQRVPQPTPQEKPDLVLDLSCDNPAIVQSMIIATFYNHKPTLADRLRYTFNIGNVQAFVRRLSKEAPGFKPGIDNLPYETLERVGSGAFTRIDSFGIPDQFIKGHDKTELGPINIRPEFLKELKLGDPIIGTAALTCANCERSRGYWIFYKVGVGGWFAETSDGSEPDLWKDLLQGVRDKGQKDRQNFYINPEPYLAALPLLKKQQICPR